jgi:hypothetical protein
MKKQPSPTHPDEKMKRVERLRTIIAEATPPASTIRRAIPRILNKGALPTFVVIGAMKCGTTSLHRYLRLHPDISVSRHKETNYFVAERNWHRPIRWYESLFDARAPVRGDFSPNYAQFPRVKGVPERMKRVLPDARIVYMVREPVERIVSQYIHQVDAGRETRTLEEVLSNLDDNHYVNLSRYFSQIEKYLEHYPQENILVMSLEELKEAPQRALNRVARHIGASERQSWEERLTKKRYNTAEQKLRPNRLGLFLNVHAKSLYRVLRKKVGPLVGYRLEKPRVSARLRSRLHSHLRQEIAAVKRFAGGSLEGWPPGWPLD